MADVIFSSPQNILKKDVYNTIIETMTTGGWTDISTNPVTDFNVMMSPGEENNKKLIIQLRPLNNSNNNSIVTTDYGVMSYRLIEEYTPATSPIAGVYNVTLGTSNLTIDGVTCVYSATPNTIQWKDATTLALLVNKDATLSAKYTATASGPVLVLTQKQYYQSPTAPIVTGSGTNVATVTVGVTSSGVCKRHNEAWKPLFIMPAANSTLLSKDSTYVTWRSAVNKNRIIFSLEYAPGTGYSAIVNYIGLPDDYYCTELDSRGLIVASSAANDAGASTINVDNNPSDMPDNLATVTRNVYCTLTQKNPNAAGKYMISEIFYGNTNEGFRGKLTGLFALPNQNILNGDIIQIGTKQYYILICTSYGSTAFPSAALAIQIA